jgi:predicted acyl esterase
MKLIRMLLAAALALVAAPVVAQAPATLPASATPPTAADIPANKVRKYRFVMPTVNHVFLPGHRIMVQVQSSWFPLYDRNPQTFVPNIFLAKPTDYVKATQRIFRSGAAATNIELPVVETR